MTAKTNSSVFFLIILAGIYLTCCKAPAKEFVTFFPPVIVTSEFSDTLERQQIEAKNISPVFPHFIGKYAFADTIDLNPDKQDTLFQNDFIHGKRGIGADDSLDANGFELVVDYENEVYYNPYCSLLKTCTLYCFYPIYFVNSTRSDKIFLAKDSYAFGIQEAYNSKDHAGWQPIEGRAFDFCGNGRWGLIVKPGEFVVVLMRKYKGDYETGLRVRFEIGNSIYVSKPYTGYMDSSQFALRDSSYLQRRMQETNGKAAAWLFYGSVLRESEWAVMAL